MSRTEWKPRTFYGAWLAEWPQDAPDGSIWEWERPSYETVRAVMVDGSLRSRYSSTEEATGGLVPGDRIRRVYPPGAVIPEPRLFLKTDVTKWPWWAMRDYWVPTASGNLEHVMEPSWIYPAQPLPGGVLVAVPWEALNEVP